MTVCISASLEENGKTLIESITNNQTKIDNWKEYYKNGQLKEIGKMTASSHHNIGKWKYYSYKGALDSIIDYDKKQPISYFNAIDIAKKYGFEMPKIEMSKRYLNGNRYWEVDRWTEMENGRSAETILINSKSGKVSKPKNNLFSYY